MFFDCSALFIGLFASVLKNKPSNNTYNYGLIKNNLSYFYSYERLDTLCGLVNGCILIFTSFTLIKEAYQVFFIFHFLFFIIRGILNLHKL